MSRCGFPLRQSPRSLKVVWQLAKPPGERQQDCQCGECQSSGAEKARADRHRQPLPGAVGDPGQGCGVGGGGSGSSDQHNDEKEAYTST